MEVLTTVGNNTIGAPLKKEAKRLRATTISIAKFDER